MLIIIALGLFEFTAVKYAEHNSPMEMPLWVKLAAGARDARTMSSLEGFDLWQAIFKDVASKVLPVLGGFAAFAFLQGIARGVKESK